MKTHKPHLLQNVIKKLKGVPFAGGHGDSGVTDPAHGKHGVQVTIAIGGHGKPPEEGSPEEEALESPAIEDAEDDMNVNAPFGGFKRPKFGKK